MYKNKKIVALVPLRGGSKSIPHKNIKKLAGKPLAFWVLSAALGSKHIDEVWVSTEDRKIKKIVSKLFPSISIHDRPPELATDTASTESVMLHFAEKVPFDLLVTLQATSPLTTSADIDAAINATVEGDYDSLVTGVRKNQFHWNLDGTPLNYDPAKRPRRQEWSGTLTENGAFYITKHEILQRTQCRLGGKIKPFEMSTETEIELDEADDWSKVAKLLKKRKN